MIASEVSLDDKYVADDRPVLVSGSQALVRMLLLQRERDRAVGLRTAGFVSGYRGSPLGGLDRELWRAQRILQASDINFAPALNEELAATALWGAQQSVLLPRPKWQGVFGYWYGKGPGVDRAGDALKHANLAGTARFGGALAVFGDDHAAKSSTTAHQSEQALVAAAMPILYPATVAELIEFGLYGWALSRYSGLWIGLKCVNETAEATATVHSRMLAREIVLPHAGDSPPDLHVHMRFEPTANEQRLHELRLPRIAAFSRANRLDRVMIDPPRRRLGLITAGKSYLDVRHALTRLGLDETNAPDVGIGLLKLGITWPIDRTTVRAFAAGYEEILIVEEKRGLIEEQVTQTLYHLPSSQRPRIVGKTSENGERLLRDYGTLEVHDVVAVLASRLRRIGISTTDIDARASRIAAALTPVRSAFSTARPPYFCSGCPHNASTVVPEGSMAMAGIGCSSMALWMDRRTLGVTQMGGEGANWIGIAPFTETPHVFQNVGDGTYVHSGVLAIRAAVAAGVNITYKLLFNGTVAMTGGQPLEGELTVHSLVDQLRAEGVRRIDVVTDEPQRYRAGRSLPQDVSVHHRRELDAVQRKLRDTKGTTVLIYDQGCAAQKRRERSRGKLPRATKRVFINSAVCEGCGDCSRKSNCVSIVPLDTEFGLKRAIDQSSCNQDLSCLEGFCPAFVTVEGGSVRSAPSTPCEADAPSPPPAPVIADDPCALIISGIGGTGIVTIGALLAMAAQLQGKLCTVYDMTGLAQKNGSVMSHVRIGAIPPDGVPARIGAGEATAMLACDLLVTGQPEISRLLSRETCVVANTHVVPTGAFQITGEVPPDPYSLIETLRRAASIKRIEAVDATKAAVASLGDSVYANLVMVGCLWQLGALPLEEVALMRAIELNGAAVDANKRAFAIGRMLAAAARSDAATQDGADPRPEATVTSLVQRRAADLVSYQNAKYARQFTAFVEKIAETERRRAGTAGQFAYAVANSLAKLMMYKDEYEVARLHTSRDFTAALSAQFSGSLRVTHYLAPPVFGARKRPFGSWFRPGMKLLARLKGLRGTPFDPFGYAAERRTERQLVDDYRRSMEQVAEALRPDTMALAIRIAELPQMIRGFGQVKHRCITDYHREMHALLDQMAKGPANELRKPLLTVAADH